ncbi:MAG: hypothetical protein WCC21_20420, partial [Candidatus Acidiferrales bacterium]
SSRPYRAIGPPLALLPEFISRFRQTNHHSFITLYPVLKQVLVSFEIGQPELGFVIDSRIWRMA